MPLLGSKRRKTEPDTQAAQTSRTSDTSTQHTLSVDPKNTENGPKSAPLRAKASSPQLISRGSSDNNPRPGLNRSFSRSWYGSWNNKASAVAQVARESISVAGGLTTESSSDAAQQAGQYMHNSLRRGRKSVPLTAEATKVNATGSHTEADPTKARDDLKPPAVEKVDSPTQSKKSEETLRSETQPEEIPKDGAADGTPQMKQVPGSQGWFGWWSRPDGYAPSEVEQRKEIRDDSGKSPLQTDAKPDNQLDGEVAVGRAKPQIGPVTEREESGPDMSSRAWFGLWSASQNQKDQTKPPSINVQDESATVEPAPPKLTTVKDPSSKQTPALPPIQTGETTTRDRADSEARPRSSGWAFWSKESANDVRPDGDGSQKHLGEIAVADTPSQSHPEAAQFNEGPDRKNKKKGVVKAAPPAIVKAGKDAKIEKTDKGAADPGSQKQVKKTIQADHAFATSAKSASTASLPLPEQPKSADGKLDDAKLSPAAKALKAQQQRPNLIEPRFRTTYPKAHVPSYWETLGYYIAYPFGLAPAASPNPDHVSVSPYKPKIKNAIAIGVHGYFPTPLVQKFIGQPTGTSIKFATHAAAAIRTWVEANQPDVPCEVEQVALEGEGFIADRVSTLWKLLLNWLSQLRNADFILVAAHSQGVPVAVMLVAKLIQLGCLNPQAKIGICAMAGVNLGPFSDYKSRFFGGSAAELFEFSRPDSRVSREYASSVEIALRHGVRVTYVGSIDDQLVSLESSLFSNLTHPYVQRAVFVDGRLHAPDFITHLVAFALKLRNLGISDHGLIRELSFPLAGSIYGGEGHSRVYDDDAVYDLALEFALETTDMDPKTVLRTASGATAESLSYQERRRSSENRRSQGGIPSSTMLANSIRRGSMSASLQPGIAPLIARYEIPASGANANPYFLPWAMRGILEEPAVKKDLRGEVQDLIKLFDEWKPVSKALKDVKFRLEAVKSKL